MVIKSQMRWIGHVRRMGDTRIPKAMVYGQLKSGTRREGRPLLRFKDNLKSYMKKCHMESSSWENDCMNRLAWRNKCHRAV